MVNTSLELVQTSSRNLDNIEGPVQIHNIALCSIAIYKQWHYKMQRTQNSIKKIQNKKTPKRVRKCRRADAVLKGAWLAPLGTAAPPGQRLGMPSRAAQRGRQNAECLRGLGHGALSRRGLWETMRHLAKEGRWREGRRSHVSAAIHPSAPSDLQAEANLCKT